MGKTLIAARLTDELPRAGTGRELFFVGRPQQVILAYEAFTPVAPRNPRYFTSRWRSRAQRLQKRGDGMVEAERSLDLGQDDRRGDEEDAADVGPGEGHRAGQDRAGTSRKGGGNPGTCGSYIGLGRVEFEFIGLGSHLPACFVSRILQKVTHWRWSKMYPRSSAPNSPVPPEKHQNP